MKKVTVLLLLALLALLVGCHTPGATGTYSNVYGGHTLQSVEKSILYALYDLEWSSKKIDHQTIEATLYVKKAFLSKYSEHALTVLISYTPQEYSIRYKNSVNLEYDIETNTIDARYDMWVDELNQRIQDRLGHTQQQMLTSTRVYESEAPIERVIVSETAPVDSGVSIPIVVEGPAPATRTTTTERVIVVEPPPPAQTNVVQKAPVQTN